MFSSTNSTINPFAHLTSSSSYPLHLPPPPPLFINHEGNDILLHHHQDPLVAHLLSSNAPNPPISTEAVINMALSNNSIMPKQDFDSLIRDYHGPSSYIPSQKPVKKDRHSKIYTAQGLRDRRVRLSIEIAREFFDLQDMLGFDKASKTLEWLLTKSKKAIKEVTQMKHNCNGSATAKSLSSTSECEVVSENGDLEGIVSKNKSFVGVSKEKKLHKAAFHLLAKESRAKARARARERTREKMCTIRPHEWKKCHDTSPQILNQLRSLSQFEACDHKLGSYSHNSLKVVAHEVEGPSSHPLGNQAAREGVIEESIVIKRKLKPSSILGYQQNFVMPKDASCNNNNNNNINYTPNLPQNWDINGAMARSTFCAISNMNLSTGLQIYGKQWEAHNNQCLH